MPPIFSYVRLRSRRFCDGCPEGTAVSILKRCFCGRCKFSPCRRSGVNSCHLNVVHSSLSIAPPKSRKPCSAAKDAERTSNAKASPLRYGDPMPFVDQQSISLEGYANAITAVSPASEHEEGWRCRGCPGVRENEDLLFIPDPANARTTFC